MEDERVGPEGAESRLDAASVDVEAPASEADRDEALEGVAPASATGDATNPAELALPQPPPPPAALSRPATKDRWIPNKNYLRALQSMGIRKRDAIKALYYANNSSADQAATWLFENGEAVTAERPMPPGWSSHDALSSPDGSSASSSSSDDDETGLLSEELYKMVFVVNSELPMGVGKVGAQVAHAAVGLFRVLMSDEFKYGRMLCAWEDSGETKICLKGKDAQELLDLEKSAQEKDLPYFLVEDAGRTQIAAGSLTVLSIIGKVEDVNTVTGKLKLL